MKRAYVALTLLAAGCSALQPITRPVAADTGIR